NTIPIRIDLSGRPTLREVVRRGRRAVLDVYDHELPFDELVREAMVPREQGRHALFDVLFVFQNVIRGCADDAFQVVSSDVDFGAAMLDLTLSLDETSDGLAGWLEFSEALFDRET